MTEGIHGAEAKSLKKVEAHVGDGWIELRPDGKIIVSPLRSESHEVSSDEAMSLMDLYLDKSMVERDELEKEIEGIKESLRVLEKKHQDNGKMMTDIVDLKAQISSK